MTKFPKIVDFAKEVYLMKNIGSKKQSLVSSDGGINFATQNFDDEIKEDYDYDDEDYGSQDEFSDYEEEEYSEEEYEQDDSI